MRFIFVCVLLGVFVSYCSDAVVFKLSNFVCKSYNESWFQVHHCRLKAVSRNKVVMNFNGTIVHPVNDLKLHIKMFKRASGFKPWLVDTKVDCCRFVRSNYDQWAKLIFSLFKEFSNFNHTCPYVGPQIVKGFYLRQELLRLPFPTGKYLLAMRWFFDQKLQFDTNVSFDYVEDIGAT